MTIAKATVTGTVYRAPEERFTQNDIAIYSLALKLDSDDTIIRVVSKRRATSDVLNKVKKGDKLLVDGRLQTATYKNNKGVETKFFEIDANDIELLSGISSSNEVSDFGEVEFFSEPETTQPTAEVQVQQSAEPEILPTFTGEPEITEEVLMPEDEIPF